MEDKADCRCKISRDHQGTARLIIISITGGSIPRQGKVTDVAALVDKETTPTTTMPSTIMTCHSSCRISAFQAHIEGQIPGIALAKAFNYRLNRWILSPV